MSQIIRAPNQVQPVRIAMHQCGPDLHQLVVATSGLDGTSFDGSMWDEVHRFDVALMDVRAGDFGGLKAWHGRARGKVLAVCGSPKEVIRAMEAGANDVLIAPVDPRPGRARRGDPRRDSSRAGGAGRRAPPPAPPGAPGPRAGER